MSLPPDWPTILQDLTPIRIAAIAAPLLAYILWQPFPDPKKLVIHPSISDRSREETPLLKRFKEVYPEDFFEGGGYAALPHGKTHYYLLGPKNAPKACPTTQLSSILSLILISGGVNLWAGDTCTCMILAAQTDHYGRGYSEAPEMEYTDVMYCTQVALLMQHVGWDKAHVVGVSMGGGIAVAFGAMFPKLVLGKVVLIAPAGLLKVNPSTISQAFDNRYLTGNTTTRHIISDARAT
ncbi:hypothetical protein FRB98_005453 [Tulasnella sp. 332]|nr:hypothetical protein FRB98_005453 [Tulasnella sp. 332]